MDSPEKNSNNLLTTTSKKNNNGKLTSHKDLFSSEILFKYFIIHLSHFKQ